MKNLNADFLLDIWADLKAKKLAPDRHRPGRGRGRDARAHAEGRATRRPRGRCRSSRRPSSDDAPRSSSPTELAEGDSKLDSYKARDPFDGLVKPAGRRRRLPAAPRSRRVTCSARAAATTALSCRRSAVAAAASTAPDSLTPSRRLGRRARHDGGGTPTVDRRKPGSKFTYQLDVKFGRPGREKRYPNLRRMSFLPSADVPALLFMGVPEDEKSALFFVHPSAEPRGRGRLHRRARPNCNFLELGDRPRALPVGQRLRVPDPAARRQARQAERRAQAARAGAQDRAAARSRIAATARSAATPPGAGYDWPMLVDGIG